MLFHQRGFPYPAFILVAARGAPEGHKDGSVVEGPSDAPGSKECIAGMGGITLYPKPTDFVFASERHGGRKPLDLAAVLKRKVRPVFVELGVMGVGWHTFRHTVGTMLAEMGEHQLTIRDYLRHSNLSVTNKYLQAASKTKRNQCHNSRHSPAENDGKWLN